MVGPTDDGKFLRLKVCSIQRNRSACRVLRAGQAATLALGPFDRSLLRKVSPAVGRLLAGLVSKTGGFPEDPQLIGWEQSRDFCRKLTGRGGNGQAMKRDEYKAENGMQAQVAEWRCVCGLGGCAEARVLALTGLSFGLLCRAWSW